MSKQDKEKVVVKYDDYAALFDDLGVVDLVLKFDKLRVEESKAQAKVDKINKDRKEVGIEIFAAIDAVQADSVIMESGDFEFTATLVKGEPSTATDEDKLKINLMKMAKLDAATIEKIFKASQVPVKARASYTLVTKKAKG